MGAIISRMTTPKSSKRLQSCWSCCSSISAVGTVCEIQPIEKIASLDQSQLERSQRRLRPLKQSWKLAIQTPIHGPESRPSTKVYRFIIATGRVLQTPEMTCPLAISSWAPNRLRLPKTIAWGIKLYKICALRDPIILGSGTPLLSGWHLVKGSTRRLIEFRNLQT